MQLKKYKQLLTTITAILLATMLLTGCSDSDSDGSGSTSDNQEPTARPLIEKSFEFEKELRAVIADAYDEHIYQVNVDEPAILNITADPKVFASYIFPDKSWPTTISVYFYILDSDFNEIGRLYKTDPYSRDTIENEFIINKKGDYYIVSSLLTHSNTGEPFLSMHSISNQNEYFLTVKKQINNTTINGSDNDSVIRGYTNNQNIYGGVGNDIIYGVGGENYIDGGDGDDIIYASKGADTLIGGKGKDRFVYTSLNNSGAHSSQRDTIKDFTLGEDLIDLSNIGIFKQSGLFTNILPDSKIQHHNVLWFENSVLYGRSNYAYGTENPEFSIALPGVTNLSAEDIIF